MYQISFFVNVGQSGLFLSQTEIAKVAYLHNHSVLFFIYRHNFPSACVLQDDNMKGDILHWIIIKDVMDFEISYQKKNYNYDKERFISTIIPF